MTKAEAIFAAIGDLCDEGFKISFEEDFGKGSLTILYERGGESNHTHVGYPGASKRELVNGVYDHFVNHGGLSFAVSIPERAEE